ncbi:DNA repair helicase family protein [Cryptosporidium andersoni]|uniref:DNA repair helicase family protein n=1 Tax=Cryptosporidium andersoni TaxID=117008 RepID=A0A1J4MT10_9CRYT|nr:DNA repair helicase family protein [Cryptosporidium andersoni]
MACKENKFGFPFTPYKIQEQFCQKAWNLFSNPGSIGIFESPTGTGKSISALCSALSWINAHHKEVITSQTNEYKSKKIPLWVLEKTKVNIERSYEEMITLQNTFLKNVESHFNLVEQNTKNNKTLLISLPEIWRETCSEESKRQYNFFKIIIASRTHSQLSQYIGEVRKLHESGSFRNYCHRLFKDPSITTVASRSHLCIHPEVRKLPSLIINDTCLEYTAPNKKDIEGHFCPYKSRASILAKLSLCKLMDIEDLRKEGEKVEACPYYAVKEANKFSDITLIPYTTLFNNSTRESLGVEFNSLGTICIIDEAHNIFNAFESSYKASIDLNACKQLIPNCKGYLEKYGTSFTPNNLSLFKQLLRFITMFTNNVERIVNSYRSLKRQSSDTCDSKSQHNTGVISYNLTDFFKIINFSFFNTNNLQTFIENNDLCRKMKRFSIMEIYSSDKNRKGDTISSNTLYTFKSFVDALISANKKYDQIVIEYNFNHSSNILDINCSLIPISVDCFFKDLMKNSRSTMLIGGTLQPIFEYKPLYNHLPSSSVYMYSATQSISKNNLLGIVVPQDVDGNILDLRYETRFSHNQLLALCQTLALVLPFIPDGVCIFFNSFTFLEIFFRFLHREVEAKPFLEQIKKKKIFRENKLSTALENEQLWESYKKCIYSNNKTHAGAILLGVLNGRLSEGVNFSDELCRCLIIVSLPYPPNTPILEAKAKYFYEKSDLTTNTDNLSFQSIMCMKIVNQCIGRALRHSNDYSVVLLLDHRYKRKYIQDMLPTWFTEHLVCNNNLLRWDFYEHVLNPIKNFFSSRAYLNKE